MRGREKGRRGSVTWVTLKGSGDAVIALAKSNVSAHVQRSNAHTRTDTCMYAMAARTTTLQRTHGLLYVTNPLSYSLTFAWQLYTQVCKINRFLVSH